MADPKLYYPERQNYQNHQQWQDAVNLHQMAYDMQDKHAAAAKASAAAAKPALPKFTGDIQGIPIQGATDPKSGSGGGSIGTLQNGYTIRYNSTTGQFEFGA